MLISDWVSLDYMPWADWPEQKYNIHHFPHIGLLWLVMRSQEIDSLLINHCSSLDCIWQWIAKLSAVSPFEIKQQKGKLPLFYASNTPTAWLHPCCITFCAARQLYWCRYLLQMVACSWTHGGENNFSSILKTVSFWHNCWQLQGHKHKKCCLETIVHDSRIARSV